MAETLPANFGQFSSGPIAGTQEAEDIYSQRNRALGQSAEVTARPLNSRLAVLVDQQMRQHTRLNEVLSALAISLGCADPRPLQRPASLGEGPRTPEPVPTASMHVGRLETMTEHLGESNFALAGRIFSYLEGGKG